MKNPLIIALLIFSVFPLIAQESQEPTCFQRCWNESGPIKVNGGPDAIESMIAHRKNLLDNLVGCEIPDFQGQTLDSKTIDLQALKGKVLVFNFWIISCPPCLHEMPFLNEMVKEFENEEVVFLGLTKDNEADVEDFLTKKSFDYQIIAGNRAYEEQFCILLGYPLQMIADKNGIVQYVKSGGVDKGGVSVMRNKIKELLEMK